MRIMQAYKTSKGIFLSYADASNKTNRETYGSKFEEEWEQVQKTYVLADNDIFFELKEVELK